MGDSTGPRLVSGGAIVTTKDCDCSEVGPRCVSVGVVTVDWETLAGGSTGEGEVHFRVGDKVTSQTDTWRLWVEGASRRAGPDALERSEEGGERF